MAKFEKVQPAEAAVDAADPKEIRLAIIQWQRGQDEPDGTPTKGLAIRFELDTGGDVEATFAQLAAPTRIALRAALVSAFGEAFAASGKWKAAP